MVDAITSQKLRETFFTEVLARVKSATTEDYWDPSSSDRNSFSRTTLPFLWNSAVNAVARGFRGNSWAGWLTDSGYRIWRLRDVQGMRQDVTEHDRDIDSALREAVAGKVGQERFDLWFGESVRLSLSEGSLLVFAADQFRLDRLRSQFRRELTLAGAIVGRWSDRRAVST